MVHPIHPNSMDMKYLSSCWKYWSAYEVRKKAENLMTKKHRAQNLKFLSFEKSWGGPKIDG